jgi:hypothetical protein
MIDRVAKGAGIVCSRKGGGIVCSGKGEGVNVEKS